MNHKKELLRGLWVLRKTKGLCSQLSGFHVAAYVYWLPIGSMAVPCWEYLIQDPKYKPPKRNYYG